MLKLATLPRSRRERDWWRATPGRSGNAPRCHYPQKAPPSAPRYACRDVFRMQRFWNTAFQIPRVWNEQSNLAGRRPLCFNGARTERRTEQRTAIQGHPLVVGGCFVFPGARTKRWPAAAAPNMPSTTARSRTLSAAAARDAPPARTQLAEAVSFFLFFFFFPKDDNLGIYVENARRERGGGFRRVAGWGGCRDLL